MAVTTAEEASGTLTTDGTEQTLFTENDAGVFFVRLDIDDLAAGDWIEVTEKIEAISSGTQRILDGSPMRIRWDAGPIIELPHRSITANSQYAVTVKRVTGGDNNIPWVEIEVG